MIMVIIIKILNCLREESNYIDWTSAYIGIIFSTTITYDGCGCYCC